MSLKENDATRNQEPAEDPEAQVERELAAALVWAQAEDLAPPMSVGAAADCLEFSLQNIEIAMVKRYLDECQVIGDSEISAHVDGALHLIRGALRLLDGIRR